MLRCELASELTFGFLIHTVARLHGKNFDRSARCLLGLSRAQCRVLFHLSRNKGINQTTLADLLDIEPITLVRLLDRMEAAGWVERRTCPTDRRAKQLFLAAKTYPVLKRITLLAAKLDQEVTVCLSEQQLAALMDMLTRLHEKLPVASPPATAPAPQLHDESAC